MAFISEIHYRDVIATNTGVPEYIEVALNAADFARLSDFVVSAYQGTGALALEARLDTLPNFIDPVTGLHVFIFEVKTTAPDSVPLGGSDAEALSLVDQGPGGGLISYFDIGGGTTNITAIGGAAAGAVSVNIPATTQQTIQFDNHGNRIDGNMTRGMAVCFATGTQIRTPDGLRPVEALTAGDLVTTYDHGDRPLLWTGKRHLTYEQLRDSPNMWPVRIGEGALAPDVPSRDLVVSPQHRILFRSAELELHFAASECFVPAVALLRFPQTAKVFCPAEGVTYHHLLFDRHEIVESDGALTESFFPGRQALRSLETQQRHAVVSILPRLREGRQAFGKARRVLHGRELALLSALFGPADGTDTAPEPKRQTSSVGA